MNYQESHMPFIIISFILVAILNVETYEKSMCKEQHLFNLIAHRGVSTIAPENTFASFNKAIELNYDMIELDIQLSREGEIVVIHDYSLERTTNGIGVVHDYTVEELKQFDAGYWFNKHFKGEKIPTLREVIEKYNNVVGLLIEIKYPDLYPGIERKLAKLLKKKGKKREIVVQTFDKLSLRRMKKLLPEVSRCLLLSGFEVNHLTDSRLKEIADFAEYVSPPEFAVTPDFIARTKLAGLKVYVWDVHSHKDLIRMKRMGIDGIVTDSLNLRELPKIQNSQNLKCSYVEFVELVKLMTKKLLTFINSV
ncbi:glycerophosphodiester phosphodiesterase [Bacillus sp. DJP31]|uniref:glycerophosphodiester phosphodiesterase n=1 Tax=Bacillus sp. DJP31 TaxID=3409789 RepID=UPI003BB6A5BD